MVSEIWESDRIVHMHCQSDREMRALRTAFPLARHSEPDQSVLGAGLPRPDRLRVLLYRLACVLQERPTS